MSGRIKSSATFGLDDVAVDLAIDPKPETERSTADQ